MGLMAYWEGLVRQRLLLHRRDGISDLVGYTWWRSWAGSLARSLLDATTHQKEEVQWVAMGLHHPRNLERSTQFSQRSRLV